MQTSNYSADITFHSFIFLEEWRTNEKTVNVVTHIFRRNTGFHGSSSSVWMTKDTMLVLWHSPLSLCLFQEKSRGNLKCQSFPCRMWRRQMSAFVPWNRWVSDASAVAGFSGWLVLTFKGRCHSRAFVTQTERLFTQPSQVGPHSQLFEQQSGLRHNLLLTDETYVLSSKPRFPH